MEQQRRLRYYTIDGEALATLMIHDVRFRVMSGIPKGAIYRGLQWDIGSRRLLLLYEHESFDVVEEGCIVPMFSSEVHFRTIYEGD